MLATARSASELPKYTENSIHGGHAGGELGIAPTDEKGKL